MKDSMKSPWKIELPCDSLSPLWGIYLKETKVHLKQHMYLHVPNKWLRVPEIKEATEVPIDGWMNKWPVVHIQSLTPRVTSWRLELHRWALRANAKGKNSGTILSCRILLMRGLDSKKQKPDTEKKGKV